MDPTAGDTGIGRVHPWFCIVTAARCCPTMEDRSSAWICYRVEAMSEIQRTLVLIKPDAVQRHLIGEIIGRYERKGLTIVAMEQRAVSKDLARKHYAEHERKSYFDELVDFLSSGPLVSLVLEGREAVSAVRAMHGKTDGAQALSLIHI